MKTNVCKCGNGEFEATQICRVDVIVDSENFFLKNARDTMEDSCYDSDHPCGDYICTKCGEIYEDLNKLPITKYFESLKINEKKVLDLQSILDLNDNKFAEQVENKMIKEDCTLFDETIIFNNGFKVNIKVCTGQSNAYTDFVLYDTDNCEIDAIVGETLVGNIEFKNDEDLYSIDILIDKE